MTGLGAADNASDAGSGGEIASGAQPAERKVARASATDTPLTAPPP